MKFKWIIAGTSLLVSVAGIAAERPGYSYFQIEGALRDNDLGAATGVQLEISKGFGDVLYGRMQLAQIEQELDGVVPASDIDETLLGAALGMHWSMGSSTDLFALAGVERQKDSVSGGAESYKNLIGISGGLRTFLKPGLDGTLEIGYREDEDDAGLDEIFSLGGVLVFGVPEDENLRFGFRLGYERNDNNDIDETQLGAFVRFGL